MQGKLFQLLVVILFLIPACIASAQELKVSPAEYLPLKPDLKYVYQATIEGRVIQPAYSIVSKRIVRGTYDIIYFVEEQNEIKTSNPNIDLPMIGLGGYTTGVDGLYTFDCTWLADLQKIPPKKPHLFLRNPLKTEDEIKVMSDAGNQMTVFKVLGFEDVQVPAGTFASTLKLSIKTVRPDGSSEEGFAWLAKGIGVVKRVRATGRLEVLIRSGSAFISRDIQEWNNLRFVFLPVRKALQKFGYQSLHKLNNLRASLPYEPYKGKIAKVIRVSTFDYGWKVLLEIENTKEQVLAEAYRGTINGLAPLADIEEARTQYQGKTLWTRATLYTYNEDLDELGVVASSRYLPVKVVEVVPGWEDSAPVRFIVETKTGWRAFVDVHMSDTNIAEQLRQYNRFDEVFVSEEQKMLDPLERLRQINEELEQQLKQRPPVPEPIQRRNF
jgi:hypothetical protein